MMINRIEEALVARGVELQEPASHDEIEYFEMKSGIKLPNILRTMFMKFNGYLIPDPMCYINLWSLRKIASEIKLVEKRDDKVFLPFGDFLIESEIYFFNINDEMSFVYIFDDNLGKYGKISDSLEDFFECVLSGKFDL
jgi:hypothetical protein